MHHLQLLLYRWYCLACCGAFSASIFVVAVCFCCLSALNLKTTVVYTSYPEHTHVEVSQSAHMRAGQIKMCMRVIARTTDNYDGDDTPLPHFVHFETVPKLIISWERAAILLCVCNLSMIITWVWSSTKWVWQAAQAEKKNNKRTRCHLHLTETHL